MNKVIGKVVIRNKIKHHKELIDKAVEEAKEINGKFVFGEDKKLLNVYIQKHERIIGTLCMTLHQTR